MKREGTEDRKGKEEEGRRGEARKRRERERRKGVESTAERVLTSAEHHPLSVHT